MRFLSRPKSLDQTSSIHHYQRSVVDDESLRAQRWDCSSRARSAHRAFHHKVDGGKVDCLDDVLVVLRRLHCCDLLPDWLQIAKGSWYGCHVAGDCSVFVVVDLCAVIAQPSQPRWPTDACGTPDVSMTNH